MLTNYVVAILCASRYVRNRHCQASPKTEFKIRFHALVYLVGVSLYCATHYNFRRVEQRKPARGPAARRLAAGLHLANAVAVGRLEATLRQLHEGVDPRGLVAVEQR